MRRIHLSRKINYLGIGVLVAGLFTPGAHALELVHLQPILQKLQNSSQLTCPQPMYLPGSNPMAPNIPFEPDFSNCNKCKAALPGIAQKVQSAYQTSTQSSLATDALKGASTADRANQTLSRQDDPNAKQTGVGADGRDGLAKKSTDAGAVAEAANQCVSDIEQQCSGMIRAPDAQKKLDASDACKQLASESEKIAAEKAKGSEGMGDMSQLADLAKAAMGMMPQGGGAGSQPSTGGLNSSDSGITQEPEVLTAGLTGNEGVNKIGFGSTDPASASMTDAKGSPTGIYSTSSLPFDRSAGSSPFDSQSLANEGGAAVGASASGGGGGLGGGGPADSSGSSRMGDRSAGAGSAGSAGEGGFEIGAGGRPPILGLKSRSVDLGGLDEEVAESTEIGAGNPLDELMDGDRNLASEEGVNFDNEATIFRVVHSKYREIKKRGSI